MDAPSPRTAFATLEHLCATIPWCRRDIIAQTLELAVEIAREGREGRRVGTLFVMGDPQAVLARSRPLILDPLAGHTPARTHISDPDLRGTLKELAQLDGAFIIDPEGTVVAACRYLEASPDHVEVSLGLGSRHLAAASISYRCRVIAIVVSESAIVRIYYEGRMVAEILPEIWIMNRRAHPPA